MIQSKQIDWFKIAFLFLAILFMCLWLRGCGASQTPQLVKIEVPEVKGNFEPKKPIHLKVNLPKNDKSKIDNVENPINQKLVAENEALKLAFAKETDSLKKQLAYEKAVELNNFSTKFEDDNLELNINGVVQGEVKEITPSYKIKAKTIEVPVKAKETVFRVLAGAEVGVQTSLNMNKLPIKGNLMFQNRKGNIISAGFDNNKTIWIGYSVSLFNYRK